VIAALLIEHNFHLPGTDAVFAWHRAVAGLARGRRRKPSSS
jgi:hypothetical protein